MTRSIPTAIGRAREVVIPALRAAVAQLEPRMALVAGYQLDWNDEFGNPIEHGGGKALRPTLAIISAEAAGGTIADGVGGIRRRSGDLSWQRDAHACVRRVAVPR